MTIRPLLTTLRRRMHVWVPVWVLTVLFAVPLLADEASQLFSEGNTSYLQGKYAEAITSYETILKSGYESGELYFNLGNAYYKSGNISRAILNYERAKVLLPRDEDLRFNLQLASLQIVDKIDPVPRFFLYRWMDSLMNLFSLSTLGWIVYIFFIVTLTSYSYFLFAPTAVQKRLSMLLGLVFSGLLILTMVDYGVQSYRESTTEFAIVLADVANIKSAPDNKGNDLFVIHKGLKVQVLDGVNHWRKIRLADGKLGWIQEEDCEVI